MALTASSVIQESMGSLKLHIVKFATVTTAIDVWNSGIPGIMGVWAVNTFASILALNGVSAAVTTGVSTGAIAVVPNIAGSVVLYVTSKS